MGSGTIPCTVIWERRRCRLIDVDRRLVAGIRMRARRPRSRVGIVYTLDREHGLRRARESGKAPYASLKNHSPLEGESAKGIDRNHRLHRG